MKGLKCGITNSLDGSEDDSMYDFWRNFLHLTQSQTLKDFRTCKGTVVWE